MPTEAYDGMQTERHDLRTHGVATLTCTLMRSLCGCCKSMQYTGPGTHTCLYNIHISHEGPPHVGMKVSGHDIAYDPGALMQQARGGGM